MCFSIEQSGIVILNSLLINILAIISSFLYVGNISNSFVIFTGKNYVVLQKL